MNFVLLWSILGACALLLILSFVVWPGWLPAWLAQFLRDGRLIIFGVLIAMGTVFFPQGLITPAVLRRPP